ncbi:MAG: sulfite exporter TauE/SafE family protein [Pseudomonadota bacterium]
MTLSLLIIFVVSAGASAFGTLIGGASLITIPLLILLGLPPHVAIGTDRFGMMGIGWAGLYKFHRKKMIDYRLGLLMALPTLIGSFAGANLVLSIQEKVLQVIIMTNIFCMLYLLLNTRLGLEGKGRAAGSLTYWTGGILCFIIGVYGGFYGAMAATFLAYVLIIWFGQTFIQSAANIKVASLSMTTSASIVFFMKGSIHFPLGIVMFSGCLCGSYLGAHYSDRIGNLWIKRFFLAVLTIMLLKMAFRL